MRRLPAFSLVELLLVMAILAIITVPLVMNISSILSRHTLDQSAENLASILRQAHIFSRENKGQKTWSVASTLQSQYVLISNNTPQTTYILPTGITVSAFNVIFAKDTGYTTAAPILLTKSSQQAQITVSTFGTVEVKHL